MCVGAGILLLGPEGLGLVGRGDGEGPSLDCDFGARVGVEIGCPWLDFRRQINLFDNGRGSACFRGGEVAWGRCSSLGVLRVVGVGWRGGGPW